MPTHNAAYVFLHKRPTDKQAWPVIYLCRELAESCKFRVSSITEVTMPAADPQLEAKVVAEFMMAVEGEGRSC